MLGDGTQIDQLTPVFVRSGITNAPLTGVLQVQAGDNAAYALVDDDGDGIGNVYSWGNGLNGTLGRNANGTANPLSGNTVQSSLAYPVIKADGTPLDNIIAVSAGDVFCIALDANGYVWAWGNGGWGDCTGQGTGSGVTQSDPRRVLKGAATGDGTDGTFLLAQSIGGGQGYGMAITLDGKPVAWGNNGGTGGYLGNGLTATSGVPVYILNSAGTQPHSDVISVSRGDLWGFYQRADGTIWAWGKNSNGELGIGNTTDQLKAVPFNVPGCNPPDPKPFARVSPGDTTVCASKFTSLVLDAGFAIGATLAPGYTITWFKNNTAIAGYPGKLNTKGIKYTATTPGIYRVEIEYTGTNGPCNGYPIATSEMTISTYPQTFTVPTNLTYCGTSATVKVNYTGTSNPKYQWFPTASSNTVLGTSFGGGSITIDPSTATAGTGTDRIVYVEEKFSAYGTVTPATAPSTTFADQSAGNVGGGTGYDMYFTAHENLTIDTISIMAATNSGSNAIANFQFRVYGTTKACGSKLVADRTNVIATGTAYSTTVTPTMTIIKIPVNTLVKGSAAGTGYFIGITTNLSGNIRYYKGVTQFDYTGSDMSVDNTPVVDNVGGNTIKVYGTDENDCYPQAGTFGSYFNWKFSAAEKFCDRIPVTLKSSCPCTAPVQPAATAPADFCENSTAPSWTATATAGNELVWYTVATGGTGSATAPTITNTPDGVRNVWVSQRIIASPSCESTRRALTLDVVPAPAAPTVTSPVTYCQNAIATALTATGTSLKWYTGATGGTGSATAPTPGTAASGSTSYYVSQTGTGTPACEGPRATITVNVTATPAAPTVTSPVAYCQNAIATALTATGTSLKWYTAATGGTGSATAPTPGTATAGSTIYYVSQSTTGTPACEGPRAAITVNVTATPAAPTVTSPVAYCQNATATALTATGTSLKWYTGATGGTGSATAPTPGTATSGSTIYYVSQSTTGTPACEGPRAAITVNVTATPSAPTVTSPVTYCQNATATTLTATGTSLLWYTGATGGTGSATAPTPGTAAAGSTSYYVSQTSSAPACESPRATITVNVTATPAAPTVSSPVAYCQNATATALTATGTSLKWYTGATGGTGSTTAPTPGTATAGSTIYYVSQSTTGTPACEGPRAAITVNVTATPAAPAVTSPVTYCQNATATALTATGTSLLWYTGATGGTGSATAPTPGTATAGSTIYYVSQSTTGTPACEGPRAAITVNVTATPTAPAVTSPVTYCQNATATALTATGTSLKWYTAATGGTGSATAPTPGTATAGSTIYYVSQSTTGTPACEGPRAAITVNVTPATTITKQPKDTTLCEGTALNLVVSASGTGPFSYQWKNTANVGTDSRTYTKAASAAADAGNYTVVVTGACGTVTSSVARVTINTKPVITVQPVDKADCAGGSVGLSVTATGTPAPTYQWKKNNVNMAGQTSASLALNSLTATDAADYTVEVSNTCAAVTSSIAKVSVTSNVVPSVGLTISTDKICGDGQASRTITLTASATGGGAAPTYTFRVGSNLIGAANQASATATYPVPANTGSAIQNLSFTVAMSSNSGCIQPGSSNPVTSAASAAQVDPQVSAAQVNITENRLVICTDTRSLTGPALPGSGYTAAWSTTGTASVSNTGVVSGIQKGTSTLTTYKVESPLKLCPSNQDTVTTVRSGDLTTPNAGTDQTICGTAGFSVNLTGNATINPGETATWARKAVTDAGTLAQSGNNATVSGLPSTAGTYTYVLTMSNGGICPAVSDEVTVKVDALPTVAAAGPDKDICTEDYLLNGNTPVIGTGLWTSDNSNVTFSGTGGAANPSATASNIPKNTTVKFYWTISNPVCPASKDSVIIKQIGDMTSPSAGIDQTICGTPGFTVNLTGNTNLKTGETVTWAKTPGQAGTLTQSGNNATVSGLPSTAGTYTYVLTMTNGGICPAATDEVTVKVDAQPTVAAAGTDKDICTLDYLLAGNTPTTGTGLWTASIPVTFDDASKANARASNIPKDTTVIFTWTISNPVCPASKDSVIIKQIGDMTSPSAGIDQTICGTPGFTVSLTGNTNLKGAEVVTWAKKSAGQAGTLTQTGNNATVSGLPSTAGSYTYVLTMANGGICPEATDEVTIKVDAQPTVAAAGADKDICTQDYLLAGNAPVTGTGLWTSDNSNVTFDDKTKPGATAGNIPKNTTVTFTWTISNPVCTDSKDSVIIKQIGDMTSPSAGPDQTICGTTGFTVNLTGNSNLKTGELVTWTKKNINDPGTLAQSGNNATVSSLPSTAATYTYILTMTNGGICPAATDEVSVTVVTPPVATITAPAPVTAGKPDSYTFNQIPLFISATPATTGYNGRWTIIRTKGTGFLKDGGSAATDSVIGMDINHESRLIWTVKDNNNICAPATDTLDLIRKNITKADVTDDTTCISSYQGKLTGNGLIPGETAKWELVSVIDSTIAPKPVITPDPGSSGRTATLSGYIIPTNAGKVEYIFRYTVTSPLDPNNPTSDTKKVVLYELSEAATVSPSTLSTCATSVQLTGNLPKQPTAIGTWTKNSGLGNVTNPNLGTSPLTGLTAQGVTTLDWVIKNGKCPASPPATLTVNQVGVITTPAVSINGGSYTNKDITGSAADMLCLGTAYTLTSNAPNAAKNETGAWSTVTPGTTGITASGSSTTQAFTPSGAGTTMLRWTISPDPNVPGCSAAFTNVTLVVHDKPQGGAIDGNSFLCEGTDTLYKVNPLSTSTLPVTYTWDAGTSPGAIRTGQQTGVSTTYKFSSDVAGTTQATVKVVPSNACGAGAIADKTVTMRLAPRKFAATAGNPNDTIHGADEFCASESLVAYKLDELQPNVETYTWYWDNAVTGTEQDTTTMGFDKTGRWTSAGGLHTVRVELTNHCSAIAKSVFNTDPLTRSLQVNVIPEEAVSVTLSSGMLNDQFCIPDQAVTFTAFASAPNRPPLKGQYEFSRTPAGGSDSVVRALDDPAVYTAPKGFLADEDLVSVRFVPEVSPDQCLSSFIPEAQRTMEGFVYPNAVVDTIIRYQTTICEDEPRGVMLDVKRLNRTYKGNFNDSTITWYRINPLDMADSVIVPTQPGQFTSPLLTRPEQSGLYAVKVTGSVCAVTSRTLQPVNVKIYEKPVLSFPADQISVPYIEGINIYRMPAVIQPMVYDTISYSRYTNETWLQDPEDPNTLLVPEKEDKQEFYVLTLHSGNPYPDKKGCKTDRPILVTYYLPLYIPNAFSPNGDGLNDDWVITGLGKYPNTRVKVYNRWGSSMYVDNDGYRAVWDGTHNGVPLPTGTYYYIVELKGSPDNTDENRSGSLTIIR